METYFQINLAKKQWPACVSAEDAAAIFGWPAYYLPFLMEKPASENRWEAVAEWPQNGFATVELEQCSRNRDWLDKAMRIVSKRKSRRGTRSKSRNRDSKAGTHGVQVRCRRERLQVRRRGAASETCNP